MNFDNLKIKYDNLHSLNLQLTKGEDFPKKAKQKSMQIAVSYAFAKIISVPVV